MPAAPGVPEDEAILRLQCLLDAEPILREQHVPRFPYYGGAEGLQTAVAPCSTTKQRLVGIDHSTSRNEKGRSAAPE